MQIRYSNGKVLDGMVLALSGSVARVAIRDEDDAAEFRLVGSWWVAEDREVVAFEFPLGVLRPADNVLASQLPRFASEDSASGLPSEHVVN